MKRCGQGVVGSAPPVAPRWRVGIGEGSPRLLVPTACPQAGARRRPNVAPRIEGEIQRPGRQLRQAKMERETGKNGVIREGATMRYAWNVCRNTVAKAMGKMGLRRGLSQKFRPSTTQADSSKTPAPNLLQREFTATAANRKGGVDTCSMSRTAC